MKKIEIYIFSVEKKTNRIVLTDLKPQKIYNKLKKIKRGTEIHVFDKTKKNIHKKTPVSDHINKTGENPLIEIQKKEIDFIDLTGAYKQKNEKKIITTSLGKKYEKEKNNYDFPSSYMAHIIIVLRYLKHKNIQGWLIS